VDGGQQTGNVVWDAAGPERMPFQKLVALLREAVGSRSSIVATTPRLALALSGAIGLLVRDVVLTKDEVAGLMSGLLVSDETPRCRTPLAAWLMENGAAMGTRYTSELRLHY
jgi:NADH dehydrogenase